jgi:hypothetical protein
MAMMTRPPGAASGVRLCVATPAFDDEATLPDVFFRLQRYGMQHILEPDCDPAVEVLAYPQRGPPARLRKPCAGMT